jgi:PAS domain S-box-containing protein
VAEPDLSPEHFRLLVESVEDYAIFVLDVDGVVRSWNAGAVRIKGYRPDEVIGRHVSTFYRSGDRSWEVALATARASGRVELHGWRIRKDGTAFWASVVITALRERSGELVGFAKVTRDLTDRAYRSFVDATNAIVWTADASGGPNADSPTWRVFTGQTEAQWRGRAGWEPVHPDDRPALEPAWARAKRERTMFEAEFRLRRHDGEYVWMASRAVPLFHSDGSVREWFGVVTDISARKAAEHEEQRARTLLATTLRSIGDGVITTDAAGRVTFLNPVAERMTGWTSAEAAGRELVEIFPIVHEETRQVVANPVHRVLREGVVVGLANHTVLLRKDGDEIAIDDSAAPIELDGQIEGVVLVFRDVTHEKLLFARREFLARAGSELIAASDYRDALRTVAQLVVPKLADWCAIDIVDPSTGTTVRLAVAHQDPAKVALAHELARRYPPDPEAPTGVPNVLRTGRSELYTEIPRELLERTAVDDEHRSIIADLDLRSAMVVPLRGRDHVFGAISFVYAQSNRRYTDDDLAFAEDFARRAAMIVERRKLEEEAAQANRAKDEFLAMLGHELRNPLAPIRTALQLMALRGDSSTARERQVIERQVEHLVTLVDDLLDVSRITRAKITLAKEPIEISAVIARALEMASPLLESRRHQLELAVPRTGYVVDGDPARLAQVFANLLTNAAKYTDPGGRIAVMARTDHDGIVVEVSDTGIGIDPDFLPMIFDMFVQERQTIARSHGGLGLGLNIARSLVGMHGGRIHATSEGRGRGSTFTVWLPALEARVTAAAEPPQQARAAEGGRRVMLVDDNEDAVALLESALQTYGYDTRYALDGPAALELARSFTPEIAILDIGLPVMDGYELAQRLRERSPELPMIALTGYGQEDDVEKSKSAGFDRHLVKPVDLTRLRGAIDELLPTRGDRGTSARS